MTAPAPVQNSGFLWREDAALKAHFDKQILLRDSARPDGFLLPTYYSLPSGDARRRQFPYATIDRLFAARDPEGREHRGKWYMQRDLDSGYRPDGYDPAATQPVMSELPVPMLINYQFTAWSRNRQHLTAVENAMFRLAPPRFGALEMVADPQHGVADDNTVRRLELVSGPTFSEEPEPGFDDPQKLVFRVLYTLAVSSELTQGEFRALAEVGEVVIDPASRTGFTSI